MPCPVCKFPTRTLRPSVGLADRLDSVVVVDEVVGTFANINVLQYADIVVGSWTKIISGYCNIIGGAAIFKPSGRY